MRIQFKTNLDKYRGVSWPVIQLVPRKGEHVFVHPGSESGLKADKLPLQLEVVGVSYHHDRVECELWYRPIDVESYSSSYGANHLFQ